jgi:hypothetical protein
MSLQEKGKRGMESASDLSLSDTKLGVQLDMWSADQIAQYYANYAMQYETDINENAHTYPTPFVLGRWCVEHMLNEFRDLEYGDQPR